MIVVSTGTNGEAFDRLLEAVAALELREELVVQHGPSAVRPPHAHCVDYLPFAAYSELVRSARVVITHAGVGSVLVALMHDKRPLVLPRVARLREAVDDHQGPFARRLADVGLATLIDDLTVLRDLVEQPPPLSAGEREHPSALASALGDYLSELVRAASVRLPSHG